ncbi:MAG: lipopolysaccharide heptosyltransferase II [Thermodesulfobacteriota bacterium]
MTPKEPHRILVRMPNWVGDLVMALPALEALRENFPRSTLVALARPWVTPLLGNHPCVDRVTVLHKGRGYPWDGIAVLKTVAEVRRTRFDLALLFQNAFEAALISRLAGIPVRIGYDTDGRGFLLSHPIPREREVLRRHQVEYYLHLIRAMGWKAEARDPRLHVSDRQRAAAESLLRAFGITDADLLVGLSPGAAYGPAKRWPAERFAAVGDRAAETWGAKVLVVGSGGEKEICDAVTLAMRTPAVNLCGRTNLDEVVGVIERCRAFVTNDSGLMHVAAALDVPLVAIFGSTDPEATGPRSSRARVIRQPMGCAPCLKPECSRGYACLRSIEPEEVWREIEALDSYGSNVRISFSLSPGASMRSRVPPEH